MRLTNVNLFVETVTQKSIMDNLSLARRKSKTLPIEGQRCQGEVWQERPFDANREELVEPRR